MDAPLPADLVPQWEKFLSDPSIGIIDRRDRLALKGAEQGESLVIDEIFDHPLLYPLQRRREMELMMRFARKRQPKVVMEIGADKGGSFLHWVVSLPTVRKAIAIEIRGTPYADLFRQAFPDVEFLFIPQGSRDPMVRAQVVEFLGEDRIDIAFLDGDKSAFGQDFDHYRDLMERERGVMMLHDVNGDAPPVRVFKSLQQHFRSEMLLDVSEGIEAQERKRKGEKPRTGHDHWNMIWGATSCGVGIVHVGAAEPLDKA